MDSLGLELVFGSTFGLLEVNFSGFETFRPNRLTLLHNEF